jgi:DNA-binding CsgD family transcriptional regulator
VLVSGTVKDLVAGSGLTFVERGRERLGELGEWSVFVPAPTVGGSGDSLAGLTTAEIRVSMLVAEGLGNPAIAARLHMSRHTVESHLKHVYRKLGISSRVELAARVLGRVGLYPNR